VGLKIEAGIGLGRGGIMADLMSVYAKMDRAYFHACDLQQKLRVALDPHSHRFVAERDGESSKQVYRIEGLPVVKPEWSLIFGDFLTNVRAALDHLACQLAELEGPSTCEYTYFPIMPSSLDKKGNPRPPPRIDGVTNQHVIDALIAVQPYTAVEKYGHPLEETALHMLNALVNIDKHRLLLVTMNALHLDQAWWGVPEGRETPNVRLESGPLEDHAPVAWFDFGDLEPYPGFDPHLALTVRLRGHGGLASLPLLELMHTLGGEVEHEIGMYFAQFFGGGYRDAALDSWRNLIP
jgi:hypothetical protein